jgi:hypothetical protein
MAGLLFRLTVFVEGLEVGDEVVDLLFALDAGKGILVPLIACCGSLM